MARNEVGPTPDELKIIMKGLKDVFAHGYGRVVIVIRNGKLLRIEPSKCIMPSDKP